MRSLTETEDRLVRQSLIASSKPIDGYVMEPSPDLAAKAASIICGHSAIQRLGEDEYVEFELFVKEVLRTTR